MTRRKPVDSVMRGLAWAAVLLCASGSANAQTSNRSGAWPGPDTEKPAATTTEKAEPARALPRRIPEPDGFTVGSFVFKPGGRIKLDIIRDFDPITSEDSFDPRTIPIDGGEGGNSQVHARRRVCSSTSAVRSRAKSCGCMSRPTSTAAAMFFGCAMRMGAGVACWRDRHGRPSWTTPTFPTPSTSSRRWLFHRSGRRRCVRRPSRATNTSWSVAVEDNKSAIQSPTGEPGKAEYPMPDVAGHFRFGGSRGHAFVSGFRRQRALPADGRRAGQRDALGLAPVWEAEDVWA